MGEWLKPAVLKTVCVERCTGVRIPLPPPENKIPQVGLAKVLVRDFSWVGRTPSSAADPPFGLYFDEKIGVLPELSVPARLPSLASP